MSARHGHGEADPVMLRPLSLREDYRQCLAIQDQTWGERFTERASVAMLMGTQRVGGVAAGAFDATQALLGFVFGFNGVREGRRSLPTILKLILVKSTVTLYSPGFSMSTRRSSTAPTWPSTQRSWASLARGMALVQ